MKATLATLETYDINPGRFSFILRNIGNNDVKNIFIYIFSRKNNYEKIFNKGILLKKYLIKKGSISIKMERHTYMSYILLYTDRVTDNVNIIGFNLYSENKKSYSSIGEDINIKGKSLESPFFGDKYTKILKTFEKLKKKFFITSEKIYKEIDKMINS